MSAVMSHAAVWSEVRRRWLVAGVLGATALAVLTPRLGAVGGNYLHAHSIDHSRTPCTSSHYVRCAPSSARACRSPTCTTRRGGAPACGPCARACGGGRACTQYAWRTRTW